MMSLKRTIPCAFYPCAILHPSVSNGSDLYRYEDYLDSQITAKDICYLEDVEIVRTLVELGCVFGLFGTFKRFGRRMCGIMIYLLAGCEGTVK